MSYLFPQGNTSQLGALAVGANINVDGNSVISIPQSVASNAAVTFDTVNVTGNLTVAGGNIVTSIVAGNNISISSSTGTVTINASSSPLYQIANVAANYTATATDEYIGVTSNPTTVTLPTGVVGKTYTIKNETNGTTTVTGTGGQQLDSSNTKTLSSQASLTVIFRGGQWRII